MKIFLNNLFPLLFATALFSRIKAHFSPSWYGLFLTCRRKIIGQTSIYIISYLCSYPILFASPNMDILELLAYAGADANWSTLSPCSQQTDYITPFFRRDCSKTPSHSSHGNCLDWLSHIWVLDSKFPSSQMHTYTIPCNI